ncbi:MAG: helix-turn-helix domain-containing protein [Candidatus Margulisbacteria bacterium]|jgi:transcriptional regulator with XRE-family HTH domain|nr:helix-turn-helix domain-containing protein [Candidatus Margulisiibacteriota bacterium]
MKNTKADHRHQTKHPNQIDNRLRRAIAAKIQDLMKVLDLSIEEAALSSELEYSNFYYIVKGKKTPRLDTLFKIAHGLHVQPEYFLINTPDQDRRNGHQKDKMLSNEILNELAKMDNSAKTFLLNMLKLYNTKKLPARQSRGTGFEPRHILPADHN